MDEYKYPLFFKGKQLTCGEKEKIGRYFQKKRDSGGGECRKIEKVEDDIYQICFKDKEVLKKKKHIICLPGRELNLTLSQTKSLCYTESKDQTSTRDLQKSSKTSTKSLEKIFKIGIYLLYYLRDNSKANKILQKQLSCISCTVELDFNEEEALVRGDIEKGPGRGFGAAEKWELQSDRVFIGLTDSYVSHHVLDPKQIRILLQDPSFTTDDIKVYTESGYSLVVGEVEAVKEKIKILEKNVPTRKELPIVEKQLKLGPDKDVQSGATKLDELIEKVTVKRLKLSTDLVTFIKSTDVVSKYQTRFQQSLRNPVAVEVGSDLVLSSLSSGALDEAEAAVLRDLSVSTVQLHGAAAVSPDLAERGSAGLPDKPDLNRSLATLIFDTMVLHGPVAQGYFNEKGKKDKEKVESTCHVIIKEQEQGNSTATSDLSKRLQYSSIPSSKTLTACPSLDGNATPPETQQTRPPSQSTIQTCRSNLAVNVLGAPTINRKLTATKIGKCLLRQSGDTMQKNFDLMAGKGILSPGYLMQVNSPPSLGCSRIFFIECLPLDGVKGRSMQVKGCLELCVQQCWISVAFPVIGPGVALKYPMKEASQVLTDQIRQFGLSASSGSLSTIHVVIRPDYPDSEECYYVYRNLRYNMNPGGQGIFRSLTSDLDEITMTIGGDGVCKDILTLAGPHVKASLRNAKLNRGNVFQTSPGSFPCKAIFHVCGEKDVGLIEQLVSRIIQRCESCQFKSVSIPAICAGTGGLDVDAVASAILRGIKTTTSSSNLHCLTNICLILIKISAFLAFKKEAVQMFPHATTHTVSASPVVHAPQLPASLVMNVELSILCTSSAVQQSVFMVMGLCRKDVDDALLMLKNLCQAQCSTQIFRKEDLASITQGDVKSLKHLVDILGLHVEEDQSDPGTLTVSATPGLTHRRVSLITNKGEKIDEITMTVGGGVKLQLVFGDVTTEKTDSVVNTTDFSDFQSDSVSRHILTKAGPKEEAIPKSGGEINDCVQHLVCCIIQHCDCCQYKSVAIPAIGAGAGGLHPDVVALAILQGVKTMSRSPLHTLTNLRLCLTKTFKKEQLEGLTQSDMKTLNQLGEAEGLCMLRDDFGQGTQTVTGLTHGVKQIERVQNLHLLRTYEMQKKYIWALRSRAVEKLLYHGTTQENCDSIMHAGFNRSFAGQNEEHPLFFEAQHLTDRDKEKIRRFWWSGELCLYLDRTSSPQTPDQAPLQCYHEVYRHLSLNMNHGDQDFDVITITIGGGAKLQVVFGDITNETTDGIVNTTLLILMMVNFTLPLYWENMAAGEAMKSVVLQSSSPEYRAVKEAFKRTVTKTVMKNIYLRRAYEALKKQISDKNLLYHGTTQDNCDSIMKTGFNRSFAGQNATACGHGTYFAVNASYSLMFVARVLTGSYTVGQSTMKVPPPHNDQQPHDRYDSLVDKIDNPSMYVVFHDSQAYPDYLITFR
ncbi:hypothetical protein Q8A73_013036 [Channa argus]|nr:hypothetical protein Q8A73_013036 [Channa argus]